MQLKGVTSKYILSARLISRTGKRNFKLNASKRQLILQTVWSRHNFGKPSFQILILKLKQQLQSFHFELYDTTVTDATTSVRASSFQSCLHVTNTFKSSYGSLTDKQINGKMLEFQFPCLPIIHLKTIYTKVNIQSSYVFIAQQITEKKD